MKFSNMQYFFTYETKIPDGVGFSLFGIWHLLWLLLTGVFCMIYMKIYVKSSGKKRRVLEYCVGFSLVLWIVIRAAYIGVIGEVFLYELPFHLCSMAGILCAIHCVTQWKWLGQVLYAICLPGTILALLFPNWNFYPVIHFITLESFLFHIGIVMYVACLLYSHKIVPSLRKLWQVVVFLAAVMIPIYLFDKHYHVNYMFVNWPSAGSPLEWMEHWLGNPGYLACYAVLILLCIFFMVWGYELYTRKKERKSTF